MKNLKSQLKSYDYLKDGGNDDLKKKINDLEALLKKSEMARKQIQMDSNKNIEELKELQKIVEELNHSPLTSDATPRKQFHNTEFKEQNFEIPYEYYMPTNDQLAVENKILHDIVTKVKEDLRLAAEENSIIFDK